MITQKKQIRILHVVTIMSCAGLEKVPMSNFGHVERIEVPFGTVVTKNLIKNYRFPNEFESSYD